MCTALQIFNLGETLMNRFLKVLLGLFLSLGSFAAHAEDVISPKEAAALHSEKKAIIVDVREDNEWNAGHIADAIHIPLGQLKDRLPELQAYKDGTIITQCRSGKRSLSAQELLKTAGFSKTYSMDGGIQAWTEQGLTTTK
jgi:rhodanese-related sulfurtransferase